MEAIMATTICIYNSKGGTGKTTTSVHLAFGLMYAKNDIRVLLLDLDGQNSLKTYFKLKMDKRDAFDFLLEQAPLEDCIYPISININGKNCSVDIIPASTKMSGFDSKTSNITGRENLLKVRLEEVDAYNKYDYIIFDCPPAFSQNTLNGLIASDFIITPSIMDDYVIPSITYINESLNILRRNMRTLNPTFLGLIPTMYDNRQSVSRQILEGLPKAFPKIKLFQPVKLNAAYRKAQIQRSVVYASEKAPYKATEDNVIMVKDILLEIDRHRPLSPVINEIGPTL
jgi:chromosome partitioning protein